MREVDRAQLETALSQHYACQREIIPPERIDDLVRLMLSEDTRTHGADSHGLDAVAFVASQVRYIPLWTWAAQMAAVVLMFVVANSLDNLLVAKLLVGVLSAANVLVGIPTVSASRRYGVAELEYSCPHDAASVLMARLIILGCSSSLATMVMIGCTAASINANVFTVALWTCPPFFCACAGSLAILRKVAHQAASAFCCIWSVACCTALVVAAAIHPEIYGQASLAMWALASASALLWLVHEVAMSLQAATFGLDRFAPHLARTYQ